MSQQKSEIEALKQQNAQLLQPMKAAFDQELATAPDEIKAKYAGRKTDDVLTLKRELDADLATYNKIKAAAEKAAADGRSAQEKHLFEKFGIRMPGASTTQDPSIQQGKPNTAGNQHLDESKINFAELAKKTHLSYDEARLVTSRMSVMAKYLEARRLQGTSK
jgi:hypothetical protein